MKYCKILKKKKIQKQEYKPTAHPQVEHKAFRN